MATSYMNHVETTQSNQAGSESLWTQQQLWHQHIDANISYLYEHLFMAT